MQQQQQFPTVGVRTIVKLGGAAITDKAVLETPNLPVLQLVAQHLAAAATADGSAGHAGASMVVVHGAGSFGHFQASDYGVAKGWGPLTDPTVRKGFCLTRCVQLLVAALPVVWWTAAALQRRTAASFTAPPKRWWRRAAVTHRGC